MLRTCQMLQIVVGNTLNAGLDSDENLEAAGEA